MTFIRTAAILAIMAAALAQAPVAAQGSLAIPPGHLRAEQLLDRDVFSTDGVEIGEVEDLIIDPADGRVSMVVIELESRLGLAQKYVSVPLDRLRAAPGERRLAVNMASAEIRSLPAVQY